ncbi:GTPase Era [Candidatus Gracilibacteria bacterium]|nr:GTPase Era [Candidatus Gracilibacteria bacterium]
MDQKKVGYVALIGRPNSGKSTFINTLIGEKVSIISSLPQTTQKVIKGIYNDIDSQIIFFDTPGINENNEEFCTSLKNKVIDTLSSADVIVRFIDSSRQYGQEESIIEELLKKITKPIITVYSKSDIYKFKKDDKILLISSVGKKGIKELVEEIKKYLLLGNLYYPEDYYTDQDIYTRISEIIREKIFINFKQEVPYSIFIEIQEIEDKKNLLKIQAYIFTESDSQKRIIIGKSGQALTEIGTLSRIELEQIFGKKVFLSLRVKVLPKWKKNKNIIKKILK